MVHAAPGLTSVSSLVYLQANEDGAFAISQGAEVEEAKMQSTEQASRQAHQHILHEEAGLLEPLKSCQAGTTLSEAPSDAASSITDELICPSSPSTALTVSNAGPSAQSPLPGCKAAPLQMAGFVSCGAMSEKDGQADSGAPAAVGLQPAATLKSAQGIGPDMRPADEPLLLLCLKESSSPEYTGIQARMQCSLNTGSPP